jgi:GDP/UDP-N,N'-diacetylbacillosamine 2-epimerase (hydrolysing)
MPRESSKRRVCFVTGTRAEFGLMRSTLQAIRAHPKLKLQLIATGSHLSKLHGRTIDTITSGGWKVDAAIPWESGSDQTSNAIQTGKVTAKLAACFQELDSQLVLVVGDRVEAFAAAAAGHISGRVVAHIHGGDRALGQVDDALRHAISKLTHVHFPATAASAHRLSKMGEESWRIKRVGSPGIDGIVKDAASWNVIHREMPGLSRRKYALLVQHPVESDDAAEYSRAAILLKAVRAAGFAQTVIVYPNNDPGCGGIIRCWREETDASREIVCRDVERGLFLGLMRDAGVLVGNSSSGIIEAASFGTPVIDIGARQQGRERSGNVATIAFASGAIKRELARVWNGGKLIRYSKDNVYGGGGAGQRIARALGDLEIDERLLRKLIAY